MRRIEIGLGFEVFSDVDGKDVTLKTKEYVNFSFCTRECYHKPRHWDAHLCAAIIAVIRQAIRKSFDQALCQRAGDSFRLAPLFVEGALFRRRAALSVQKAF